MIELKHHVKHVNENWNPIVLSSSCPNWTSFEHQGKNFGIAMLNCDCLQVNVAVPQSIQIFLWKSSQSKHWNEASSDFETFVQNTQQIIWKYLAKFDDTADLSLVLVLQPCGCGTELQRGTWSGHGWCSWVWWMTWRDRSGFLVGSTSGFLAEKRYFFSVLHPGLFANRHQVLNPFFKC